MGYTQYDRLEILDEFHWHLIDLVDEIISLREKLDILEKNESKMNGRIADLESHIDDLNQQNVP